ncbi:MAG: CRTAC1 family protein [Terriglobales bacterium]
MSVRSSIRLLCVALAVSLLFVKAVRAQTAAAVQEPARAPAITFTDVTRDVGITWKHVNGATPDYYLIETMGGGAAFLDYNRDGRLDIFLVQSGCHKLSTNCTPAGNALYRQNPDGSFTDVSAKAGVATTAYGQGVAVDDYDNDGDADLYVTAFPRNTLLRNHGDGTFTDVTEKAGVAAGGWSSSAAFFDYNRDGFADLFVGRYLEWNFEHNPFCGERRPGMRSYCHPDQFRGISNRLYRNNRDGTFTDVTEAAGVTEPGKALGVVAFDFNQDGWLDLYVANDAVRNFLFRNNGNGTFTEMALLAEVAYGSSGKPASGMGTDAADYNGDGLPDLFVTNIDFETNNLFQNHGDETFTDVTVTQNLGAVAILFSGFGTRFLDYDNDRDLDIAVANGHPLENVHLFKQGVTGAERPFLLENRSGRFEEVGAQLGAPFTRQYNGRGLAVGDYDNDGDPDLLIVENGGTPALLRNDGGDRNAWVGIELAGRGNQSVTGARVVVTSGGRRQVKELTGGASYCSVHDRRLLFGLGAGEKVDKVEVRWPSGGATTLENLPVRRYHGIQEPAASAPAGKP